MTNKHFDTLIREMEFRILLLKVKKALCKDEVKALAFLCTDLLGRNPTSVESASALFSRLVDQDHLSPERPHLLTELLLTIQRNRLVHDLSLSEYTTMNLISKYRKLLYNLSEEITGEDLKDMKFLLNPTLPRRRLKDNTVSTTLEVFLEMERTGHLSETNLNELEAIIQSVCPVLKEKIAQFKALPGKIGTFYTSSKADPGYIRVTFREFTASRLKQKRAGTEMNQCADRKW
uniref:DED domain-containing protein n=1 Tax=Monopterus albus TaxID=43700 RepID=A0A3Q3JK63_MONAL